MGGIKLENSLGNYFIVLMINNKKQSSWPIFKMIFIDL